LAMRNGFNRREPRAVIRVLTPAACLTGARRVKLG
jgi:hypothetical protein